MPGSPTMPLLSLCLATYNRARYLDRYLTHHLGALDAAGVDYELVVSDNCSADETPEILARYASRRPRMRVTRQPRNVGVYPNILTTLHQARGEVVVSIADDDMAIPDQLLAYVQRMIDEPSLVMIQAPWLLTDETKDNAVIGKFYDFEGEWRFETGQYGNCLAFVIQNHVFPECWVMRRSAMGPRSAVAAFWRWRYRQVPEPDTELEAQAAFFRVGVAAQVGFFLAAFAGVGLVFLNQVQTHSMQAALKTLALLAKAIL